MSIQVYLISWMNLNYKENSGKKSFSCKSKPSTSYILTRKTWLWCPKQKEWRLLWRSKFVTFHGRTLIIRKITEIKAFLANLKHQFRVFQYGEQDCNAHNKKNGDYNEYQVCLISQININYKENSEKQSFSCKSKSINIVYPNEKNMIVVPIIKGMEIITSIQVCLISWMNSNYKENGGKKIFSCKSRSINIMYSNEKSVIVAPN